MQKSLSLKNPAPSTSSSQLLGRIHSFPEEAEAKWRGIILPSHSTVTFQSHIVTVLESSCYLLYWFRSNQGWIILLCLLLPFEGENDQQDKSVFFPRRTMLGRVCLSTDAGVITFPFATTCYFKRSSVRF